MLAQLLERAGTGATGSVTGIYTVLVDGDDHNEPIADAARSILDGHVVLDRKLAVTGHFPSVDAIASISRVATRVTTAEQRAAATALRSILAARRQAQDLIDVGAYVAGSNPKVDAAVEAAASTNDEAAKQEQYAIIQQEIVRDLPYIPVVVNASQTFMDTQDFTGWPTQDDLYAFPPSWSTVSLGVVLSKLEPAS